VLAFYCEGLYFFESLGFLLFHFLLLSFNFALCSGEEALLLFGKFFWVLFNFWFVSHCLLFNSIKYTMEEKTCTMCRNKKVFGANNLCENCLEGTIDPLRYTC